jgi:hypothetical protein
MSNLPFMSRRKLLATGLASGAGSALWLSNPATVTAASTPVLVELFTSQGCSSCPPADKLAGTLVKDPQLIVLSFNVDYWDYLGWRDTLAKPEYSQRQYDYARSRGDADVYTPQMVINGTTHVVGSQRVAVEGAIRAAGALPVNMALALDGKEIKVEIAAHASTGEATLWLMAVAPEIEQVIERGENTGKTITYHNVVRNLVPAAMWKGEALRASWMRDAVMPPDCRFCVAILQEGKAGRVLAVARA